MSLPGVALRGLEILVGLLLLLSAFLVLSAVWYGYTNARPSGPLPRVFRTKRVGASPPSDDQPTSNGA